MIGSGFSWPSTTPVCRAEYSSLKLIGAGPASSDLKSDVSIGACEFDPNGGVRASGTLTNWTSDPADYRISLSFRDGNGGAGGSEFGATSITVDGVEEHATTNWSASVPVRPEGTYTCRIVRIDRWVPGEDPPPDGAS